MKNSAIVLMAICGAFLLTSCYGEIYSLLNNVNRYGDRETMYIMADYAPFNSINHLTSNSTDIIRAEVLDERTEKINVIVPLEFLPPELQIIDSYGDIREYLYDIFTIYRIKILEVFKGDTNIGDIVEVRVLGGQYGNMNVVSFDDTFLTIGDDLILFMYASFFPDEPFFLSNASQAVYRFVEPDPNSLARVIDTQFESLNARNNLILTMHDLEEIKSRYID